jgi:cytochrome c
VKAVAAGRRGFLKRAFIAASSGHGIDKRIVGPSFAEVAAKYKDDVSAAARLGHKVRKGGSGAYGAVPMPAQPGLAEADVRALVGWILSGSR